VAIRFLGSPLILPFQSNFFIMDQIKGIAEQIATQFGLDWWKFIAQVVIFLMVYGILKAKAFGPILAMLEQRKQRIADGEAKLEKISKDLAEAESNAKAILEKANSVGDRLVKEAGESAKALAEKKQQDAIHEAGQIMAKAREAATLEHEQLMSQLKREFGRMVSDATSRVTGKVLNDGDKATINKETVAQVSA
jgi:F-type H+-transporting ATPase subunit b